MYIAWTGDKKRRWKTHSYAWGLNSWWNEVRSWTKCIVVDGMRLGHGFAMKKCFSISPLFKMDTYGTEICNQLGNKHFWVASLGCDSYTKWQVELAEINLKMRAGIRNTQQKDSITSKIVIFNITWHTCGQVIMIIVASKCTDFLKEI